MSPCFIPKRPVWILPVAIFIVLSVSLPGCKTNAAGMASHLGSSQAGRPLTTEERKTVMEAIGVMAVHGLPDQAKLADDLLTRHMWRAALPNDEYLAVSEKQGYTPYAYTLSDGKHPNAIVLGPKYFKEADTVGRASLMLHEMGHYMAYIRTGRSDEVDGYKAQYDTHTKIGLSERDGLVYFSMLDGVEQYVIAKYPKYAQFPDVKAYIKQ
jgi:hypothetical protein